MYMHVCMCMYVCVYLCMYVCMYVCMHVTVCVCIHVFMCVYRCACPLRCKSKGAQMPRANSLIQVYIYTLKHPLLLICPFTNIRNYIVHVLHQVQGSEDP